MRRDRYLPLALIVLAVLGAATAWAETTEDERFEQTVAMAPGGRVSLQNTNGHVTVETWNRDEVLISALKKARARGGDDAREILEEIKIRVTESAGGVTIETDLPRGGWLHGTSASVAYELKVPASASLDLRSTNGQITVEGVDGDVALKTTNGAIRASRLGGNLRAETTNGKIEALGVAGTLAAETTNGSIDAEITAATLTDDVELSTTNGGVTLTLAPSVAARIDARAGNGSVRSDLPLGQVEREKRNALTGALNGGGPTIRVRTSNGSIRLREG